MKLLVNTSNAFLNKRANHKECKTNKINTFLSLFLDLNTGARKIKILYTKIN